MVFSGKKTAVTKVYQERDNFKKGSMGVAKGRSQNFFPFQLSQNISFRYVISVVAEIVSFQFNLFLTCVLYKCIIYQSTFFQTTITKFPGLVLYLRIPCQGNILVTDFFHVGSPKQ